MVSQHWCAVRVNGLATLACCRYGKSRNIGMPSTVDGLATLAFR